MMVDSTQQKLVTIFGGSGFVGTQIVQRLARRGHRIRVAVRRPDLAGHLRPLGRVGQIYAVQANVRDDASVAHAVQGADIVINLVGIGFERGNQRFEAVHAVGAERVAKAARAAGAEALVHMSALGADPDSGSAYARTKAEGEARVLQAFPDATIMRPSIQFGQGDGYFSLMGRLARFSPFLPLISGDTRFQPVYVGDVADAFVAASEHAAPGGRIYELGGPEVETQRQLLQRVIAETGRNRLLLPLGPGLAKLLALPMAILPRPLLTSDQVELLGRDNVVSSAAEAEGRTINAFGIAPVNMDTILPTYMWQFRKHGQFDRHTSGGTTA